MEKENEKKVANKNGAKKTSTNKVAKKGSASKSTKKTEANKSDVKKVEETKKETTKKSTQKPKTNNNGAKKPVAKKTTKKIENKQLEVKQDDAKVEKKKVKETTKKVEKELTNKEKVEVIKKAKKVVVKEDEIKELKEENKKESIKDEKVISNKTWILTALCGLLIIVSIIAFSLANKFEKVDPTDYYAYVEDNSLMLWDREDEKGIVLSSTFLTNPNKDFNYANESYYLKDEERIYFIDNVEDFTFDLNYIDISEIDKKERKTTRLVEGITSYAVKSGVVVYEKDSKLYVYNEEKEIATKVTAYRLADDGKNLFYIDKDKNVFIYNISTKENKKVDEKYEDKLYSVDNDLYTVHTNGYLYDIYKNGTLFISNVTDYGEIQGEFIYYRYDESLDKTFDELTKKYEESKITFEDIKKIVNTKERVLLFIGKPTCSYCTLLEEVFTEIKKEKDFTHVYINTIFMEDAELSKLLKFSNVDETKFGTPTLVVTENGKAISSHIGYMEKEETTKYLETNKIFTSKFKYENKEKVSFTPEVMFWASNTYTIEKGKEKLLTNGAIYLNNDKNAFNSDYYLSFVSKEDNYNTTSASDLYYGLSLNITKSKNDDVVDNKILYSELKTLYMDTRNGYLLYQTQEDEKANFAKIKNGKLKDKGTVDTETLCNVASTIKGTMFIKDCDDYGFGTLTIWNGSKEKEISKNVYQVFEGTDKYSYYIKFDEEKEVYLLYSHKNKEELVDEVYYAIQPTSDVFYIKENVKVITNEDQTTTNDYSYELYIMNEDNESILLTEKADTRFLVVPIK